LVRIYEMNLLNLVSLWLNSNYHKQTKVLRCLEIFLMELNTAQGQTLSLAITPPEANFPFPRSRLVAILLVRRRLAASACRRSLPPPSSTQVCRCRLLLPQRKVTLFLGNPFPTIFFWIL